MAQPEWGYLRPSCETCHKTRAYLEKAGKKVATVVDGTKTPIFADEALAMLDGVDHIYTTRGRAVTHIDLRKDKPDEAALRAAIIGPTGKLRAPTLRRGRTLLVGFEEGMYRTLLK